MVTFSRLEYRGNRRKSTALGSAISVQGSILVVKGSVLVVFSSVLVVHG